MAKDYPELQGAMHHPDVPATAPATGSAPTASLQGAAN
jgi:hypothetical protein